MLHFVVLFVCGVSCCGLRAHTPLVKASALPAAVQLGGAIVAAVEQDVEQEEEEQQRRQSAYLQQAEEWLGARNDVNIEALQRLLGDSEEGARGKYHKRRKLLKYLYPFLVGVLIAKTVLIPLVLKMLTALSTSSFVMSKIALVTAGLLALKWLLAGAHATVSVPYYEGPKERTHLEIVHLPYPAKAYQRGALAWNDLSWSGSNVVDNKLSKQPPRQKYIPVVGAAGNAAPAEAVYSESGLGYRYKPHPQHNYDGAYDGKPFL